jgi:2-(1,2-epoxy-1,2-dihydrophenyl)acetyl-CoA isomerase
MIVRSFDETKGVARLTLSRPKCMNALNMSSAVDLEQALRELAETSTIRVVVITGAGRAFCAGGDVQELATPDLPASSSLGFMQRGQRLAEALAGCGKVTIARINGAAVGAGLALALGCDYRIMASSAVLSTGFVRAGLTTDLGMSWLLPRIVGWDRAKDLLLTGRQVEAPEALRVGLITHSAPDEQLDQLVASIAALFPREQTHARAFLKHALHSAASLSLGDAMRIEALQQALAMQGREHAEALRSMQARRLLRGDSRHIKQL